MKSILATLLLLTSANIKALTVGSYNIRNFDYDTRYKIRTNKGELAGIISKMNVDVLSIEEINNGEEWDKFVQNNFPGYDTEVSRCGGEHGQRLGFLYNKEKVELLSFNEDLSVSDPGTDGACDSGSRPLTIGLFKIRATGQKFYGLTAHLKSGPSLESQTKRKEQFKIIKEIILELRSKTGINDFFMAGDLNTTEFLNKGQDYATMSRFLKEAGMVNISENLNCTAYYWGGTNDGIETPSKLDHVIVTPGLIKLKGENSQAQVHGHCQKVSCREVPIKELGISYESVSDHCPLSAKIQ